MKNNYTTTFENGLIWFGAAVSIAEIMTGTYFAPLGLWRGILAVLLGHIIGFVLMFSTGIIGGRTGKSSMEAVKLSFGHKGALFFAFLNIIQLVGWTSIMIYEGAASADSIVGLGNMGWCLIIGALICLWLLIGIRNLGKLNTACMLALFVLTVILSLVVFGGDGARGDGVGEIITFGAAVELAVAMPLSWLPLINDYTQYAKNPVRASAVSSLVYGVVSCWMYIIGMGAAIFAGENDVARIMLKSGLGTAGLVVVVLSTVTTTFLDAYSAGVSAESISKKLDAKKLATAVAIIGAIGAALFPISDITDFLYLIGSVFAPMTAVQLADHYILKKADTGSKVSIRNFALWFAGFIIYRLLMRVDIIIGCTLVDVAITMLICVITDFLGKRIRK